MFTIAKKKKKGNNPNVLNGKIFKLRYFHTLGCYAAIKSSKLLMHATAWKELSEKSQYQKVIGGTIPFLRHF